MNSSTSKYGNYKLTVRRAGFQKTEYQAFDVAARATKRIDMDLKVASQATSVRWRPSRSCKPMPPTSPRPKEAWS